MRSRPARPARRSRRPAAWARGWRSASRSAPPLPGFPGGSSAGRSRSRRRPVLAAEHLEAELLLRHLSRVIADDLAFVDEEAPVGEGEDLRELERDEQDRAALVALLHQPAVEVLDRADVE